MAPAARQMRQRSAAAPAGANVTILENDKTLLATPGNYGGPFIYQQFYETPTFAGRTIVLGSWMVNGYACGLGIREDESVVTSNTSRFVPHRIEGSTARDTRLTATPQPNPSTSIRA